MITNVLPPFLSFTVYIGVLSYCLAICYYFYYFYCLGHCCFLL